MTLKALLIATLFSISGLLVMAGVQQENQIKAKRLAREVATYRMSDAYIRYHTVMLLMRRDNAIGLCSGIMIQAPSGKLYILSASHCASTDQDTFQVFSDSRTPARLGQVKIVAIDRQTDLLLLEPVPSETSGIPIAKTLIKHDEVRSFGYGMFLPNKKSVGELLMMNNQPFNTICEDLERRYMISNVHIIPGDSGGPVVSSKGELVGINQAYDRETEFACIAPLGNIQHFLANR